MAVSPKRDADKTHSGAPTELHLGPVKKTNWLAWILLGLGILALLLALSRCNRAPTETATTVTTTTVPDVVAPAVPAIAATAGASVGQLGAYLGGSDAAPRTFTFDNLNFDTAKSEVRPDDQATVDDVAGVLGKFPAARIKIVGFADARGDAAANVKLGEDRANSVKAALVAKGIDAGRIDTGSGGATAPIATNATTTGEAENRRTELVVLNR